MPLKALDTDKDKYVLSFWFEDSLDIRAKHPRLVCPCCKGKMAAKGGNSKKVTTHFAHVGPRDNCPLTDRFKTATDLLHHTMAVKSVYDHILPTLPEGFTLDLEHCPVDAPERRADIAVLDASGAMVQAHEIQLTHVPTEELDDRTLSYENAGAECVWWFGKGCDADDIKGWSLRSAGYYQLIEFDYFNKVSEPTDFFVPRTERELLKV